MAAERESRERVATEQRLAAEARAKASIERTHYRQITAEQRLHTKIVLAQIAAGQRLSPPPATVAAPTAREESSAE